MARHTDRLARHSTLLQRLLDTQIVSGYRFVAVPVAVAKVGRTLAQYMCTWHQYMLSVCVLLNLIDPS